MSTMEQINAIKVGDVVTCASWHPPISEMPAGMNDAEAREWIRRNSHTETWTALVFKVVKREPGSEIRAFVEIGGTLEVWTRHDVRPSKDSAIQPAYDAPAVITRERKFVTWGVLATGESELQSEDHCFIQVPEICDPNPKPVSAEKTDTAAARDALLKAAAALERLLKEGDAPITAECHQETGDRTGPWRCEICQAESDEDADPDFPHVPPCIGADLRSAREAVHAALTASEPIAVPGAVQKA